MKTIVQQIALYNDAVANWTELKTEFDKTTNPDQREPMAKMLEEVGGMLVEKVFEILTTMTHVERWALKLEPGEVPFEMEAGSRKLLSFKTLSIMEELLS